MGDFVADDCRVACWSIEGRHSRVLANGRAVGPSVVGAYSNPARWAGLGKRVGLRPARRVGGSRGGVLANRGWRVGVLGDGVLEERARRVGELRGGVLEDRGAVCWRIAGRRVGGSRLACWSFGRWRVGGSRDGVLEDRARRVGELRVPRHRSCFLRYEIHGWDMTFVSPHDSGATPRPIA